MTVSILGCGWFGQALAKQLLKRGYTVKGSVTDAAGLSQLADIGIAPYLINIIPEYEPITHDFFECDILVVCITPKFRQGQAGIYPDKIKSIIKLIEINNVTKVIYTSSTAVYGDNNREVNETDVPEPDTEQGRILLAAENFFKNNICFKTTIIRLGGLIGPGRNPGRFFAGKTNIPDGFAPVNLVHLYDCVGITMAIISMNNFDGIFNAVMPFHPDKTSFYTNASMEAGLPKPAFIEELKNWKIVSSLNCSRLLNYKFKFAGSGDFDLKADYNI